MEEDYQRFTRHISPQKLSCFTGDAKTALDNNFAEWLLANTVLEYDGEMDFIGKVFLNKNRELLKNSSIYWHNFEEYLGDLFNTHLGLYMVKKLHENLITVKDVFTGNTFTAEYPYTVARLQKNEVCGLRILKSKVTGSNYVGFGIYRFLPNLQEKLIFQIPHDCSVSIKEEADEEAKEILFTRVLEDYVVHGWMVMSGEIEARVAGVIGKEEDGIVGRFLK